MDASDIAEAALTSGRRPTTYCGSVRIAYR
jgi:hypothetical protein